MGRAGQSGRDLVLEIEQVGWRLVEALGPQMRAALRVDELRIDPDPVARVLHAAFEHVSHAELATDLAGVDRLSLISEGGVARDHENARPSGAVGPHALPDSLAVVVLVP